MKRAFFWTTVLVVPLLAGLAKAPVSAPKQGPSFKVVTLTDGLRRPWGMAFLPNGDILITERSGNLRVFRDGKLQKDPIKGLPSIRDGGQGGLLDVAVDPQFNQNKRIYLSYVSGSNKARTTAVAQARLGPKSVTAVTPVFYAKPALSGTAHFGSRLLLSEDGYLYITLGERYRMHEAQDTQNHLGAVIRLFPDGAIPRTNPFATQKAGQPEIFTYGHRNVQGIAQHPETQEIWIHEHGPRGGDEVNILKKGRNYGWPVITYGIDYNGSTISEKTAAPGMEQPVIYWTPSIAPCGMAFYNGDVFTQWRGSLFVGALAGRHLRRLELDGNTVVRQEVLLKNRGDRIRDVEVGPDGYIYVLTDSANGRLLRLEPAP